MKVEIITLFPRFFEGIFDHSMLKRAVDAGVLEIKLHNLRDYADDKHHLVDDYRFGGGPGMLLKPEPLFRLFDEITRNARPRPTVIYPTPQGVVFNQDIADELSGERHIIFLCGHYKGIDQRVIDRWVDREYSIGDYVLTGGEAGVAVMIDAAVRMIPGVLGDIGSARGDSFRNNLLDCAHYTRPEVIENLRVPGVLMSGHHRNIELWRRSVSMFLTRRRRPDLLKKSEDT